MLKSVAKEVSAAVTLLAGDVERLPPSASACPECTAEQSERKIAEAR